MKKTTRTEDIGPHTFEITDCFYKAHDFWELGEHLTRCSHAEFAHMNTASYQDCVRQGMRALTESNMPSHVIVTLAEKIKDYPTLWEGLKEGLRDGLDIRLTRKACSEQDLARLVFHLKEHQDLSEILREKLDHHGIKVVLAPHVEAFNDPRMIVLVARKDSAEVFYTEGRHILGLHNLPSHQTALRQQMSNMISGVTYG